MPANLPPTYYKLKHEHEAAKTDAERLVLLEEMLRIVPKHKGSEKVVADLRRRIARIKKGEAATGGKKGSRKGYSEHIPKQGAGQIVLLGPPNGGKSQILAAFTKAKPAVFTHALHDNRAPRRDAPLRKHPIPTHRYAVPHAGFRFADGADARPKRRTGADCPQPR